MSFFCCTSTPPNLYLTELGDEAISGNPEAVKLFRQAKAYEGKQKTYQKAQECYKQAAEMGLVAAQAEYGICLVEEDQGTARKWLQKAADKNSKLAQDYLNCLDGLKPGQSFPTSIRSEGNVMFMTGFPGST